MRIKSQACSETAICGGCDQGRRFEAPQSRARFEQTPGIPSEEIARIRARSTA
jgi:hypothetical protein